VLVARVFAGLMLAPSVLGSVWYWPTFDGWWISYSVAEIASLAAGAVFPRTLYRFILVRGFVIAMYVSAIALTLPMLVQDVGFGDPGGFVMRLVCLVVLVLLVVEVGSARSPK
jgi:hypothetical protein